ncbi:hypothetical protein E2C01_056731 [Portunus trituberculatus]|uniref:Uncharacterized protein n=1 Tax=Portunus trituberculatus TaxID=210409 RepID=A0A5B7GUY4_PORTR|nr:hypothetical protein [Portunus trituberculatus]
MDCQVEGGDKVERLPITTTTTDTTINTKACILKPFRASTPQFQKKYMKTKTPPPPPQPPPPPPPLHVTAAAAISINNITRASNPTAHFNSSLHPTDTPLTYPSCTPTLHASFDPKPHKPHVPSSLSPSRAGIPGTAFELFV